jgi:hypothetical protein
MQLVGAHKVHLADEGGQVTTRPQVVGDGRHGRGKLGGIVVRADPRSELTRHHGETRRCTKGVVAIGRLEHHPFLAEPVEVRRLPDSVAVGRQGCRRELVGLNQ